MRLSDLDFERASTSPERSLWLMVLLDACELATGRKKGDPIDVRLARWWVETKRPDVGGFDWTCELLDIDPAWLRGLLLRTPATQQA
jgi:hypothetical protein